MFAPIAIFPFNRPEIFKKTIDSLAANTLAAQSHITIFCDGPRHEGDFEMTNAVRAIAHAVTGFASVTVVEREKNLGPAGSIINGIKTMFEKYDTLIFLEEDTLCSPHTLEFFNDGLTRYKENAQVFHIAAWSPPAKIFSLPSEYAYDVYAIPRFNCWGWASWKDRFDTVDWAVSDYEDFKNSPAAREAFNRGGEDLSVLLDGQMRGEVNTWDVQVDYSRFRQGKYGINPVKAYTTNIGFGSGTHTTEFTDKFDNDVSLALPAAKVRWLQDVSVNEKVLTAYQRVYASPVWRKHLRAILLRLGLLPFIKALLKK